MWEFLLVVGNGLSEAQGNDRLEVVFLRKFKFKDGSGHMLNNPCIGIFLSDLISFARACRIAILTLVASVSDGPMLI